MALITWEPAREIQTIQQEMNRLFGTFLEPAGGAAAGDRRWIPAMDLFEDGGEYVLKADLPGVAEDEVKIEVEDRVLTISGRRASEQEERREGYRRFERASGAFARTLTLPEGVDADAIRASYDKGVLEVRVPKPQEAKPRRVAIRVGDSEPVIEGHANGSPAEAAQAA